MVRKLGFIHQKKKSFEFISIIILDAQSKSDFIVCYHIYLKIILNQL
jgi:hypothetical protein